MPCLASYFFFLEATTPIPPHHENIGPLHSTISRLLLVRLTPFLHQKYHPYSQLFNRVICWFVRARRPIPNGCLLRTRIDLLGAEWASPHPHISASTGRIHSVLQPKIPPISSAIYLCYLSVCERASSHPKRLSLKNKNRFCWVQSGHLPILISQLLLGGFTPFLDQKYCPYYQAFIQTISRCTNRCISRLHG